MFILGALSTAAGGAPTDQLVSRGLAQLEHFVHLHGKFCDIGSEQLEYFDLGQLWPCAACTPQASEAAGGAAAVGAAPQLAQRSPWATLRRKLRSPSLVCHSSGPGVMLFFGVALMYRAPLFWS